VPYSQAVEVGVLIDPFDVCQENAAVGLGYTHPLDRHNREGRVKSPLFGNGPGCPEALYELNTPNKILMESVKGFS
jgi:hypothetical protein